MTEPPSLAERDGSAEADAYALVRRRELWLLVMGVVVIIMSALFRSNWIFVGAAIVLGAGWRLYRARRRG